MLPVELMAKETMMQIILVALGKETMEILIPVLELVVQGYQVHQLEGKMEEGVEIMIRAEIMVGMMVGKKYVAASKNEAVFLKTVLNEIV